MVFQPWEARSRVWDLNSTYNHLNKNLVRGIGECMSQIDESTRVFPRWTLRAITRRGDETTRRVELDFPDIP